MSDYAIAGIRSCDNGTARKYFGTTDEDGILILSLSENTYNLFGIKDGYNEFIEEVDITTGVVSRKNIELIKTA